MKKILLSCVAAVLLMTGCVQQKVSSFSSVSQQIAFKQNAFTTFDNTAYLFVYGTPTLNEYVPRGEDISNWQHLLAGGIVSGLYNRAGGFERRYF